ASGDQTVKLWAKDGQLLHTFAGNATTFGVAFHPRLPLLAATNLDGSLQIWELESKTLVQTIQAHNGAAWSLAFSPTGEFLVSGGADHHAKVWNLDGTLLSTLSGHQSMVWQVAVGSAGQMIASASLDNTAKVWTPEGQLLSVLPGPLDGGSLWSLAFNASGDLVATGGDGEVVQLWQLDGSLSTTLEGHTKRVEDVAFAADGRAIASASLDRTLWIWGKDGSPWRILQIPGDIRELSFSPSDVHSIVTTGTQNTAQLRQWETPLLKTIFLDDEVWDSAVSPQGDRIISGDSSTVHVWDTQRNIVATLQADTILFGFDFSPDGQMIATSGHNGTLKLWTRDGRFLRDLEGHQLQIWDAAFSADNQRVVAGAEDGSIRVWTVEGDLIHTLKGHDGRRIYRVAFSPDTQTFVTAGSDGTLQIWDAGGNRRHVIDAHDTDIFGLAVSPDGRFIASASADRTAKLWRWDGTLVTTFEGHATGLFGVDFSADGQMVATASADNTVTLWTLAGEPIKTLYGHGSGFKSVKFSATGDLVTVTEDGTLTLWNLEKILALDELEYACAWIADYLRTNRDVAERDRALCDGLSDD
ncbi:MAG: WD40 repeat domain-containing protein, partial [Cyanobacteria bacterium P01_H01_bin.119]